MGALLAFFGTAIGRWVVVGALVSAALFAGGVYERSVGYREGLAVGDQRIAEETKANAKAVIALNAKYRNAEVAHRAEVDGIKKDYEGKLSDEKKNRDIDVAAARAGAIKLRIANPDRSSAPAISADPAAVEGARDTELPPEITANLFALAYDANEVAQKLNACEALLEADRNLKGTQ